MINQPKKRDRSKLGATTTDTPGIRLDVPPAHKRTAKSKKTAPAAKKKSAKR